MHHNLIYSVAWSFSNGDQQSFEELKSEATLAYLEAEKKYKPSRNVKFTTFAYTCMTNRLITFLNKENQYFASDEIPEQGYSTTPLFELLEGLSERAQFVANLLIDTFINSKPNASDKKDFTPREVRGYLNKRLTELGWNNYQRKTTIIELKQFFN